MFKKPDPDVSLLCRLQDSLHPRLGLPRSAHRTQSLASSPKGGKEKFAWRRRPEIERLGDPEKGAPVRGGDRPAPDVRVPILGRPRRLGQSLPDDERRICEAGTPIAARNGPGGKTLQVRFPTQL